MQTPPPKTTKKQLQPFGGINAKAEFERMRAEAIRTRPRQECFDLGYLTVKDLDDEELRLGRCRDSSGRIPVNSKKTELIPRDKYDEMIAEHELRYKQKLRQNLDTMLDVMIEIAQDDTVEPRDRFEAAKYIFERTAGRTPNEVTVNVKSAPYEELLNAVTGIAPISRAQHRQMGVGIIDAEFVDEEEVQPVQDASPAPQEAEEGKQPESPDLGEDTEEAWLGGLPEPVQPAEVEGETTEMYHSEGDITTYGRRADEKRSYNQQQRDAEALRLRRKEAKQKVQEAKKKRKVARALGNDEITTHITGMNLGEDGKLRFETEQ